MANNSNENIPQAGTSAGTSAATELVTHYDPIGTHLLELRRYYLYLVEQLEEMDDKASKFEKQIRKKRPTKNSRKIEVPKTIIYSPPAFPMYYPFSQSFQNRPKKLGINVIKYCGGAPKDLVDLARKSTIKDLILQAGFAEIEDESGTLNVLSNILEEYLQKFAITLSRNKRSEPFSKDQNLWNALECTLRDFGIGGIAGLHVFYYENVVKKHDALLRECIQMFEELKKRVAIMHKTVCEEEETDV